MKSSAISSAFVLAAAFGLWACSNGSSSSGCTVGVSASCTCANGEAGAQVCQPGGTFGACFCESPGGGGSSSGSSTVGSSGGSSGSGSTSQGGSSGGSHSASSTGSSSSSSSSSSTSSSSSSSTSSSSSSGTGSSSSGSSTSSSSGSSSSTGSSSSGSSGVPVTFCDGFGLTDGSGNQFLIETYAFSKSLQAGGCYDTLVGYSADAGFIGYVDGDQVGTAGGILDVDIDDNTTEGTGTTATAAASPVLFPGGCDDMGLGSFTGSGTADFTAPDGGLTVASVVSAQALAATATVYGVVTAIFPWAPAAGATAAKSGNFYVQDPVATGGTPAAGSGILVYLNKSDVGTNAVPNRGDVVALVGFTWSPYDGENKTDNLPGFTNSQNQIASGTGATVTVIGSAPLPPPVSLTAAQLAPNGTGEKQYYGMRVAASGGPFTVDGANTDCPAAIESTVLEQ